MPIERELKFRLAPRAAPRVERELALSEPKRLHSIYFDTPDRALERARMALRLRRAGRRWLQTLKGEISGAARHEWEMPVAGRRLELERFPREEVIAATGSAITGLDLQPVFETRFTRRTREVRLQDAALELALDRGRVIAADAREPICELEIELKSGAPSALLRYADSLLDSFGLALSFESKAERGARLAEGYELAAPRKWRGPSLHGRTPGEALAALVEAALEQACRNAGGVLRSHDPEYLHQLRVGLRRLRSTLSAFKALAPEAQALKAELRVLTPTLGAARDWDVFVAGLSPRSGLWREASRRRLRARNAARGVVASSTFNRFLLHGFAWIEQAPWQPSDQSLPAFAAHALERLHRKAARTAERVDWRDADQRHALRIRVKRLRYACDAFAGLFSSGEARPYLAALERLQDRFGELNDIATARTLLNEIRGKENRMLDARERQLTAGLPRAWRDFARRERFWRADT